MAKHKIEFRHLERLLLPREMLEDIVRQFSRLTDPVVISFDRQISDHGSYTLLDHHETQEPYHYIRISTKWIEHLDARSQAFDIVSTLLHELEHAHQMERLGPLGFDMPAFACCGAQCPRVDDYYSQREIEARRFENDNILKALEPHERFIAESARGDRA